MATASNNSISDSPVLFEYDCEAVRVRAKKISSDKSKLDIHRKFSVDPNLTNFNILKSILARAFDIGESDTDFGDDFIVYFASGSEWLPLLSDWDLDVAIIGAAEPCLNLIITERGGSGNVGLSFKKYQPVDEEDFKTETSAETQTSKSMDNANVLGSIRQVEKKLVLGLTNRFQKVLSIAEESIIPKGQQFLSYLEAESMESPMHAVDLEEPKPLNEKDFKSYLNKVGEVVKPRELRLAIYQCGMEPHLRKVAWKHLLGVYPPNMTGKQRVEYMKQKVFEYEELKKTWTDMMLRGRVTDDLKYVTSMVKKDVLRTDRQLGYFSGEGNANITMLYNILATFALNHPSVGYCQGMSDLLSPILFVMGNEGHAYVSFCALMFRLKPNFLPDGKAMTKKFEHLSQGILYYDPEFYSYLKQQRAEDLLYCYRWLLLEMKREFSFEDANQALEVLWASLPPPCHDGSKILGRCGGINLFEQRFGENRNTEQFLKRRGETTFNSVVNLRKRLSASSEESSPLKKDTIKCKTREIIMDSRGRIQSDGSDERDLETFNHCSLKKSQSLETASGSKGRKIVTNLNEFYCLSPGGECDKKSLASQDLNLSDEVDDKDTENPSQNSMTLNRLPTPAVFGGSNPFLMFMCIAAILQHRDYIIEQQLDYQEIAMYFDRLVRRHNLKKTLNLARKMFADYLNDDWKRDVASRNSKQLSSNSC